jgi:hypothetical protein
VSETKVTDTTTLDDVEHAVDHAEDDTAHVVTEPVSDVADAIDDASHDAEHQVDHVIDVTHAEHLGELHGRLEGLAGRVDGLEQRLQEHVASVADVVPQATAEEVDELAPPDSEGAEVIEVPSDEVTEEHTERTRRRRAFGRGRRR